MTSKEDLSSGQAKIQLFKHEDGFISEFNLPNYGKTERQTNWAVVCIKLEDTNLKITRL